MSNNDMWRQAVELADGFDWRDEDYGLTSWGTAESGYRVTCATESGPPQWLKDAIAAQLVRQVDALNPKDKFDKFDEGFTVECTRIDCGVFEVGVVQHGFAEGGTRTENTVNAILDSGVL